MKNKGSNFQYMNIFFSKKINSTTSIFQLVKLLVVINLILFLISGFRYVENNIASTLELNKTVSELNPATGVSFFYTLQYRCASTIDDCIGTVITDPLPPEVEYIGLTGSAHTVNEVYDAATHTVTFTFQNNLPSGSTGEVRIEVRYPNGVTPNGTTATNTATIDATNGTSISSSVSNTAFAEAVLSLNKFFANGGGVGSYVTYGFRVCNTNFTGNTTEGKLNIEDIYVIDTLPPGAVFVESNLSGGNVISYDPITNVIQFSVVGLEVNECRFPRITVLYSDPPYDINSTLTNTGYVYGTPVGENEIVEVDSLTHGFQTPIAQASGIKSLSHQFQFQGGRANYIIDFEVDGTEGLDDFCVVDTIPEGIEIQTIFHGGYFTSGLSAPEHIVNISYTTNLNGPQLISGSPFSRFSSNNGGSIDVENDLGLPNGGPEYITSISWCFGDIPAGLGTYDPIGLSFQVRADAPVGVATNCLEFTTTTPSPNLIEDCVDLIVQENTDDAVVFLSKNILNTPASGSYNPGDTIKFRLLVLCSPSSTIPLVNPEILDLLPEELSYVPGSWQIGVDSDPISTSPIFTETPNHNGSGRTLLAWSWTGAAANQIEIDERVYIEFEAAIYEDAVGGLNSFYNSHAVYGDDITTCFGSIEEVDIYDINNDGNTTELLCFTRANVNVNSLTSLESEKLVKGQLDSTYSKFPDVAHSVPGGISDYILNIRNTGNIAMDSIVIIDIFPSVGDEGVIDDTPRESRWQPNLVSTINAPSGIIVSYSLEENPCRPELDITGPVGCSPPNWSTTPPADLTTVRAVKFEFGNTLLQPQSTIQLSWAMRVPVNIFSTIGTQPDSIAWNSFGFVGRRTDNGQYILPSEPIKVGIDVDNVIPNVYGDFVWEDTNQNGLQDGGELGIDGVRVELFKDNGDGITDPSVDTFVNFTLTANGGFYLFPNLPDGDYYSVFYYTPSAMELTINDIGGNDELDSDGIAATYNGFDVAVSPIVTLDNFAYDLSWDLGLYPSSNGTIGNYIWNDINENGIQDEGPSDGINGVRVYLYNNNNPTIPLGFRTTTDDVNGNPGFYFFADLLPGDYFLEMILPSGAIYTTQGPTGNSDPSDSDFNVSTNKTEVFTVTVGNYDNTWDGGLILPDLEICGDGIDNNGDGLIDCIEASDCIDTDNDNILDGCDLDDDNDGILDIDEGCICETFDISSLDGSVNALDDFNNAMFNLSGATIQIENPLTFGGSATLNEFTINDEHELGSYGLQLGVKSAGISDYLQSNYIFSQPVCGFNAKLLDIDNTDVLVVEGFLNGTSVNYSIVTIGSCVDYDLVNTFESSCNTNSSPANGNVSNHSVEMKFDNCIDSLTFRIYENGGGTGGSFTFVISSEPTCSFQDTDGDGLADCVDLDSDNDGCVDAIEGGGSFTIVDVDANGMLTGGVDVNGIPSVVGNSSQTIGTSIDSTITSGCEEICNNGIDDDDDGLVDCLDPDCPCYTPFTCEANAYISYSSGFNQSSTFSTFNTSTTPFTLEPIGDVTYSVNAIGYRNQDDFIYGIEFGTNELVRIGSDGIGYNLGEIQGLPIPLNFSGAYDSGDIFPDGYLYVHEVFFHNEIYQIDVTTTPAQLVATHILDQSIFLSDFAYNKIDDKVYGIGDGGDKYMIDPSNWTVTTVGVDATPASYGAAYTDDLGRVYVYRNNTGELYVVDFGINGTGTGDLTLVANAPQVFLNDGASCGAPFIIPEICDNGIDDDFDGDTDCDDTDCKPNANPAVLNTCDNSNMAGSGIFFLYDANPTVSTESGVSISYHSTLADAQNGINHLISPYTSSDGTVYVRVERIATGCYDTALTTLDVDVKCVESCVNGVDDDGDGLVDTDDSDCPCSGSN